MLPLNNLEKYNTYCSLIKNLIEKTNINFNEIFTNYLHDNDMSKYTNYIERSISILLENKVISPEHPFIEKFINHISQNETNKTKNTHLLQTYHSLLLQKTDKTKKVKI